MNEVSEERRARKLLCVREDENGGAMFCQQTKPRAGAQTNFCDGKNLVAGESLLLRQESKFKPKTKQRFYTIEKPVSNKMPVFLNLLSILKKTDIMKL